MDESPYSFLLLALSLIPIGIAIWFVRDWITTGRKTIPGTVITFWIAVYGVLGSLPLIVQPILHASMFGLVCYVIAMIVLTTLFGAAIFKEYRERRQPAPYGFLSDLLEDLIYHSFPIGAFGMSVLLIAVLMNTIIWLPF